MGGNTIIFQAFGVLLILFFLFVAFMCAKSWKWFHVVMLVFVFGASVAFLAYASLTLKTHAAWRSQVAELDKQVAEAKKEGDLIAHGDLSLIIQKEPPDPEASLRSYTHALRRMLNDRGRVWRGCTPTNIAGNSITVRTVAAGIPAEDAKPNNLQADTILFAFREVEIDAHRNPMVYLGKFKVTAADANTVTFTPVRALDAIQVAQLQMANQTWALYDVMPIDSHYHFADTAPGPNFELPLFGEMNEAKIRAWMPKPPYLDQERYEAIVQQYLRDGGKPNPETDPPETIWIRVRFTKAHKMDVDSGEGIAGFDRSFYDLASGRALLATIRRGTPGEPEQAEFIDGDFAVFDQETAEQLIASGVCAREEPVYVRKLNDFDYEFDKTHARMLKLAYDIDKIKIETAHLQNADAKAKLQVAYRQKEALQLEEDKTKFLAERDAAEEYLNELNSAWSARRKELSHFYQTNLLLERELDRINTFLKDEIDRRTAAATAALP